MSYIYSSFFYWKTIIFILGITNFLIKAAMKILITGGSGLLGQYLNLELSKENQILTTYYTQSGNCKNFYSAVADIRSYPQLKIIFESFKPEVVIHTAAIADPQLSTSLNAKEVYDTNVSATKKIAELCDSYSAKLIYTSTDLVYAGYRGSMLKEDAKLNPISLYAETKLMAEIKIQETFDNYLILRIALLYGFGIGNRKNHFHQMYNDLKAGTPVKLFFDQFRTPLSLPEAARVISELCRKEIKSEIINVGGKERVSRVEMGEILCNTAGFDKNLIQKISMNDLPGYPAVEDVSLNTEKLQSSGIKLKSVEESVKEILSLA